MTTQASLDVWSSRLHEMKIEEQKRTILELRTLLLQAMGLIDGSGAGTYMEAYDAWWDRAELALKDD